MKTLLLLALLPLCLAQDKKQIDFKQTLMGIDHKPMIDADKKPVTLGSVAGSALMNSIEEDRTSSGADKYKLFVLAEKVLENKGPFTVEDIALIKTRIGKFFGPAVVGPAWNALDPALPDKK